MAATVTLGTTTLANSIGADAGLIKVASTSGMFPGYRLYLDGELMQVLRLDIDPWVYVIRGVDGTAGVSHQSSLTIYVGRPDQFYEVDPVGRPTRAVAVTPYINVRNGTIWLPQGDEEPTGANRWWQKQTVTYEVGALGIRTTTLDPTVSS